MTQSGAFLVTVTLFQIPEGVTVRGEPSSRGQRHHNATPSPGMDGWIDGTLWKEGRKECGRAKRLASAQLWGRQEKGGEGEGEEA